MEKKHFNGECPCTSVHEMMKIKTKQKTMHSTNEKEVERSSGEWDKLRNNKWIKNASATTA